MKDKERLLITGGSGFLGSHIPRMSTKGFEVFATYNRHPSKIPGCDLVPLDIRDQQRVISMFERIRPDLVIHTAALANVDYCEDHAEEAWLTNVGGTENVSLASKEVGAKVIYISTDSVFDGERGMYAEEDIPAPLNTYAKTKLEGEKMVQRWLPGSIVVRTAFYGWSRNSSSKPSLAEWIVSELRERRILRMFTDVFFSPIFVDNLVEVMMEMHYKGLRGIYHVGGRERCSKHAFGQEIAQLFLLDRSLIRPSSVMEASLRAPRPKDLSLNIAKVSAVVNIRMLDVKGGITRFRDSEHYAKRVVR